MNENKNGVGRRETPWNYLVTVIVSAAMGAALTWLFMSQRSGPPLSRTTTPSTSPPLMTNAIPDVSRMPPGQAALVRGNFAYDHQQWSEAIRSYQEAIGRGIDNADVHTDLGNALRFSGQPEEALNQYTIAQRITPQHENSLFNQISLFIETMNQPTKAAPVCEEFIRRFPNSDKLPAVREQLARAKQWRPKPFSSREQRKPSRGGRCD